MFIKSLKFRDMLKKQISTSKLPVTQKIGIEQLQENTTGIEQLQENTTLMN